MILWPLSSLVVAHVRPRLAWRASTVDIWAGARATWMAALANATPTLAHVVINLVEHVSDALVVLQHELSGFGFPLCCCRTNPLLDAQRLRTSCSTHTEQHMRT